MIRSPSYRLRGPKSNVEVRGVSRGDEDVLDTDSGGSTEDCGTGFAATHARRHHRPHQPLVYGGAREPRFRGGGGGYKEGSSRGRQPYDYRHQTTGPSRMAPLGTRHVGTTGTFYRSKCYEPDKKPDIKFTLPEDTRISKLLRRLDTESDQGNSLTISKKLLQVLMIPENSTYVRRAFRILGESMLEILRKAPGPVAKGQAARALGRMGYLMGQENDFARFQRWLFEKVAIVPLDIGFLLIKALKETLDLDAKKPVLRDHAENLMHDLVSTIEVTENPDEFKAALDVLVTLVESYPEEFHSQFRDAADLLFGWHVDHTQPLSMVDFISTSLQRLSKHFQDNLDFSVTLVHHFFEDIDNYACQLLLPDDKKRKKKKKIAAAVQQHLVVSVLALNTVLKCLGDAYHPDNNRLVSTKFITDCLSRIVTTLRDAFEYYDSPDNDLMIAGNESVRLLLPLSGTKPSSLCTEIYTLIDHQLSSIDGSPDATVVSMLAMISRVVKEVSANLPIEIVGKLVGPQSPITKLRASPFVHVREATVSVYQSLLNLKNIPLLQEAYRYVLLDLQTVLKRLVPETGTIVVSNGEETAFDHGTVIDPELSALFLLRCFSQLAGASGSIIGLWALQPSILELLGVLLEPFNENLTKISPTLQYCILHLLYNHCKCYNHFIASSNLVANKTDSGGGGIGIGDGSPNSGNLVVIFEVLHRTLRIRTAHETTLLLLNWLTDLLMKAEPYLTVLYAKKEFLQLAQVLIECGYSENDRIALAVCSNLDRLLRKKELSWSNSFLVAVTDLCTLHMNSSDDTVRNDYTELSLNVPWDIALLQFDKTYPAEDVRCDFGLEKYRNRSVILARHLHASGADYGEMQPLHFKMFAGLLLENRELDEDGDDCCRFLQDIIVNCWCVENGNRDADHFRTLARNSRAIVYNWATLEAAQFCVNSKLRTPLGKPNETFTSIEGALKNAARQVGKSDDNGGPSTASAWNTDRKTARLLLQFVEHLEKAIYNASEGCTLSIRTPAKVVRTFFNTNASTCREWLSRIRAVVIYVALHAGLSTVALRHGQYLLKDLENQGKAATVEFERGVMYVTLALLNLGEHEALYGLYRWTKNVAADGRFDWVKYASEQANKKYEIAYEAYKRLLREDATEEEEQKKQDVQIRQFVSAQIVNCCKELNDWNEIVQWQKSDPYRCLGEENGNRFPFGAADTDTAEMLANYKCFNELSSWEDKNTTTTTSSNETWSVYETARTTESALYKIALRNGSDGSERLDGILKIVREQLQDSLLMLPAEFLQDFSLMHYVAQGLKSTASNVFLVSENFEQGNIEKIDSTILNKILWWSEYFSDRHQNLGFNAFCSSLRLHIIGRARKERNYRLAEFHVRKFFDYDEGKTFEGRRCPQESICGVLLKNANRLSTCSVHVAKSVHEIIKLSYTVDENKRQTVFNLCAAASTEISKNAERFGSNEMREISSRILLKLASWLQSNNEQISLQELNSPLGQLLMVLPEIGTSANGIDAIPSYELAIGKLLQFSINQCSSLAKTFNAFATWCYRWGRRIVDQNFASGIDTASFTPEDEQSIREICVARNVNSETVYAVLSSKGKFCEEEELVEVDDGTTASMVEAGLRDVPGLDVGTAVEELLAIWKKARKRVYVLYESSAEAYFKYLQLASSNESAKQTEEKKKKKTECNTITATLRILRLIVKHAFELRNVLEQGLAATPTEPWKVIIPQLFSRLNHPEPYVRQRVAELLCRVAEDALQLITFPAVVGAFEGGLKFEFSEFKDCFSQSEEHNEEVVEEEAAYDSDGEETRTVLRGCFETMVDTLSKRAPETISQVRLLVKELRRIALLWDELWLGTLLQHQGEIVKRQRQLETEIERVNENANLSGEQKVALITEKYRIVTKPIVFILDQLKSVTIDCEPETPHEKQFKQQYSEIVGQVLDKLKNPDRPDKPSECWQPLRLLQVKLQQKAHKRTAHSLRMRDISPVLGDLKDTVIAMPGCSSKTAVTISHVSNHVSILLTKTKPKKLVFHGSDGKTYTYLFKGLEDLHLDERIMQFLSIANSMMMAPNLRARHYAVIPLGPRSGLISWVDGTTPIFSLYKRWQQREATKTANKTNAGTSTGTAVPFLRPSELFYNKLNPLLQQHRVKNVDNRRDWPLPVLKQVLTELMAETPRDLLAKELWCHSIDAGEWWQVVRNYSYSVAVMSIIGYIIGLGDRHLNNMLVELTTGEVVHIDYNVCFEKGKTLRVPEKVPFRLTPNIVEALGVTGVEGIFRSTCENVLKTMKKGRETLLTLLEAFIYDPLVDWTVGAEGLAGTAIRGAGAAPRQTRKELEKEITVSMYHVRCTEMRTEWESNRDRLTDEIPRVIEKLKAWVVQSTKLNRKDDFLQDLHQQLALVKEAEAHAVNKQHSLYSLPGRYESHRKTREAFAAAVLELESVIDECDDHAKRYGEALKRLESHVHSQWIVELNVAAVDREAARIFDLVKEFLQNAGQSSMVAQCEQSENDVERLAEQQISVAIKCLHVLQEYATILSQSPPSFREKHRTFCYANWCKYLMETKESTACEAVFQQFHAFIEGTTQQQQPQPMIKSIMEFSYLLNLQYSECGAFVAKTFDKLAKLKETNPAAIESNYDNAKLALSSFLRFEKDGFPALKYVTANDLSKQNKEYHGLEMGIFKSADYAHQYPSQKGCEWIFDDLLWYSSNSVEYIGYLSMQEQQNDGKFARVIDAVQAINGMYRGLQELYHSFHTIILPESMKKILGEEPSVLLVVGELDKLVSDVVVGSSLFDLEKQLEKQLRCIVMEMDVNASHSFVSNAVNELRTRYQAMVQATASEVLTQGKMLLMGFNGLFDKLDVEFAGVVETSSALRVPNCWRRLDQVRQAKSIAPLIFDPHYKAVIDDIFFLKRLRAMTGFFALICDMCASFKGAIAAAVVYDDTQLAEPVKKFIIAYAIQHCFGISTETNAYAACVLLQEDLGLNVTGEIEQKDVGAENEVSLDELIKKGASYCLRQGAFSQNVLAQASSFQTNAKASWTKVQEVKQTERRLCLARSSLERIRNQTTAHSWVHEEPLRQNTFTMTAGLLRKKFVIDLRTDSTTLKSSIAKMDEARKQRKALIVSVNSRLNWAAGVNPDVNQIASAFEDGVGTRERKLDVQQQICESVHAICDSILRHESLRSHGTETETLDNKFLNAWTRLQAACQFADAESDDIVVTRTEESIMQLFGPNVTTTTTSGNWVSLLSERISQTISEVQKELTEEKENLFAINDGMFATLDKLRNLITKHGKLMADIKPLVQSMTKIDECSVAAQNFIDDYRTYAENFTPILYRLKKETTKEEVAEVVANLEYLKEHTDGIYEQLLALNDRQGEMVVVEKATPPAGAPDDGGRGQQKNAYAMSVWRRVRLKLEGRDPDPGRKCSNQEQVDYVIGEANSLDNLALLYEGWTPWV